MDDPWDTEWDEQIFWSFWAIFCSFTSIMIQKNKVWEKLKKPLEISAFYTCVPQMTITSCMFPEVWGVADNKILKLFFSKIFLGLQHANTSFIKQWKKKNFVTSFLVASIVISCCFITTNDNHVMYVSWGMGCGGQHFLLSTTFWTIFCLFVPLTTQKLKLKKNENKSWRSHHFTHVQQNLWLHDVQFLRYGAQQTDRQIENSDI